MVDIAFDATAGIPPAEVGEVDLYHPKSWWTRYVFSQDAKVIAIQLCVPKTLSELMP
jgi:cytochrome c oxidase subunit 1